MPEANTKLTPLYTGVILVLSLMACALSIYQWYELIQWRGAGITPLCSIGEHLSCNKVWDSPLSHWVQRITRIPLPGWGVAWAVVVMTLSARLLYKLRSQGVAADLIQALRLTVLTGVAVVITLLLYSAKLGTFCPTCIGYYVFVLLIAYYALRYTSGISAPWIPAFLNSAIPLLIVIAVLFYPGAKTPQLSASAQPLRGMAKNSTITGITPGQSAVGKYLMSLKQPAKQAISQSLADYRASPALNVPTDPKRLVYGTVSAPVHVMEWIDIRCPHCRHMEEALEEIREYTPPGSWSWELHQFPLDGECNPLMRRSGGGISCLAAKIMICQSGSPEANPLRDEMFKNQRDLTKERIWQLAASSPEQREQLQKCVDSQKTRNALQDDIQLALRYRIEGTPLIVINKKKAAPIPIFIYSMILAAGQENDTAFQTLPAANKSPGH